MTRTKEQPRETPAPTVTGRSATHQRPSHPKAVDRQNEQVRDDNDEALDEGLDETFPASDPVSATRRG